MFDGEPATQKRNMGALNKSGVVTAGPLFSSVPGIKSILPQTNPFDTHKHPKLEGEQATTAFEANLSSDVRLQLQTAFSPNLRGVCLEHSEPQLTAR